MTTPTSLPSPSNEDLLIAIAIECGDREPTKPALKAAIERGRELLDAREPKPLTADEAVRIAGNTIPSLADKSGDHTAMQAVLDAAAKRWAEVLLHKVEKMSLLHEGDRARFVAIINEVLTGGRP